MHVCKGSVGHSSDQLLIIPLSEQDAANTKDDGQDTAQEDKIEQHACGPKNIICTNACGSSSRLVPVLHDIVVCAEVTLAIPMRYIVVEASLVAGRTGAGCVLRTTAIRTASSFMLM